MRPITLALALALALIPNPKSTEELTWNHPDFTTDSVHVFLLESVHLFSLSSMPKALRKLSERCSVT
jgi:hypothetical protein